MIKKMILPLGIILVMLEVIALLTRGALSSSPSPTADAPVKQGETFTLASETISSEHDEPGATDTPVSSNTASVPVCFAPQEIFPVTLMPDNRSIFIRASSGVRVFDLGSGSLKADVRSPQSLTAAALAPDGKTFAWALQDGTLQLVDLSSQKTLASMIGHLDPVGDLQFSPAGDRLFSASHDGAVRIWDLNGNLLDKLETGSDVLGFGISMDGSKLATIPFDGPVTVWDLARNTKSVELGGTGGYDTSDAYFSPDGQYLAADLATGIYLWRLADASLVWHQVTNSMAVTFSSDGQYLAYSDIDDGNKAILAAPDTAQTIRVIDEMQSPVWDLTFSPDATMLAVVDGVEIHVWQVEDGVLLATGKATCP